MKRQADHIYSARRFRRALRFYLVGRSAQAVASIAFTLLAIRLLPQSDYGVYMVLLGLVDIFRPLSSLGLLPAVQQFLPEMALHASSSQLKKFVRLTTALRLAALVVFAAALFVAWGPVARHLGFVAVAPSAAWLACALVVTLLGAGYTNHMLEALLEQRFAQVIRALLPIGRLLGLAAVALVGEPSLVMMLWVDLAVSGVCMILAEILLWARLRQIHPDGSRRFAAGEIVRFAWHLSGAQVLDGLGSAGMLRAVVSATLGATVAGHFAFMQQVLQLAQKLLPSMLLASLVRPMLIAANVQGNKPRIDAAAGLLRKSNLALSAVFVASVFIGGDPLVAVLSGGRLAEMGMAFGFIALGAVSASQSQVTAMLLQVFRRSGLVRVLSSLALLTLALAWLGSMHGLLGAAVGVALGNWMRSAVSLGALHRYEPWLNTDMRGLLMAVLAVACPGVAAVAVGGQGIVPMLAALGLVVPLMAAVKPLSRNDLEVMAAALRGRYGDRLIAVLQPFVYSGGGRR